MKILWSSNAPWSCSGYGTQTKYILPRLQKLGHEVAVFAWDGLHHGRLSIAGVEVLPGGYMPFGADLIGDHVKAVGAELVISLQDVWVLPEDYRERMGCRWAAWFPVDGFPVSPRVLKVAKTADYPLVYSRFGEREALAAGLSVRYIPHGVETAVFRPGDKVRAREAMGIDPGWFLAVSVGTNRTGNRKAHDVALQAFARFLDANPEARLYVHCDPSTVEGGQDLHALCRALGIGDRVLFPDRYQYLMGFSDEQMAAVYQAADVLLGATMAEGFGLPIIEAQACGCPVITTNHSSMPELTFFGEATEPAQLTWNGLNCWHAVPSVANVHRALMEIAALDDETLAERSAAVAGLVQAEFGWDVVVERYWRPFLESLD